MKKYSFSNILQNFSKKEILGAHKNNCILINLKEYSLCTIRNISICFLENRSKKQPNHLFPPLTFDNILLQLDYDYKYSLRLQTIEYQSEYPLKQLVKEEFEVNEANQIKDHKKIVVNRKTLDNGLFNPGNYCYANTTLQFLFSNKYLREFYKNGKFDSIIKNFELQNNDALIMKSLSNCINGFQETSVHQHCNSEFFNLINTLPGYKNRFKPDRQCSFYELLCFVIDSIIISTSNLNFDKESFNYINSLKSNSNFIFPIQVKKEQKELNYSNKLLEKALKYKFKEKENSHSIFNDWYDVVKSKETIHSNGKISTTFHKDYISVIDIPRIIFYLNIDLNNNSSCSPCSIFIDTNKTCVDMLLSIFGENCNEFCLAERNGNIIKDLETPIISFKDSIPLNLYTKKKDKFIISNQYFIIFNKLQFQNINTIETEYHIKEYIQMINSINHQKFKFPISKLTIENCFNLNYGKEERKECVCKGTGKCYMTTNIQICNEYLNILLNRSNISNGIENINSQYVEFQQVIKLLVNNKFQFFKLISVVYKTGGLKNGHYYCSRLIDKKWIKISDQQLKSMDPKKVSSNYSLMAKYQLINNDDYDID